jgi:hypothetical protein
MSCPYPVLAAESVVAIEVLAQGAVAEEDMQAAEAQQGVAVALDLDDRGRIAIHSKFVVVLVIPAVAGAVAVLRFPMSCSKC